MGKYTGELKSNQISLRMTDTAYNYLISYPGENLNQKFASMMNAFSKEPGKIQKAKELQLEVDNLKAEKAELLADITRLQSARETLKEASKLVDFLVDSLQTELSHDFVGEILEKRYNQIEKNIRIGGFKPNRSLILKIDKLNQITKHKHTIKDISKAMKENAYMDNQDAASLVEEIAEELKNQELERVPDEVEISM